MHERKEIEGKASGQSSRDYLSFHLLTTSAIGKQIVYHALQSAPDKSSTENDVAAMDDRITKLRSELTSAKSTEKNLKLHLTALSNLMTIDEQESKVSDLECEKESLLARLVQLKKVNVKPVLAAERATIEEAHAVWGKHVNTRKRICKELWWKCLEAMPEGETVDELWVCSITLWGHTRVVDQS
jgi:26S proteasome regulatory subunit, ATPase 3, interacting protein